ncbi:MAG TPA: DegT/DnrJ/EryC1/StrS family aminotransferase [Thermoanaerobaculia bacterium]|nr:DegT/DnrJ/EryC1/StrS family aminotransferase [Thermoanaerobaculia bacterium]
MRGRSDEMTIPYLDLSRIRARIDAELRERWCHILDSNAFVLGPEVREFEQSFADYLDVDACAGLANGTDALLIALQVLGLRPGDEVLVPAFSFFATAEAVALLGGRPVFCDVDPETLNLDARDAAARVTSRTVGVIGVHLYGRPFDVDAVLGLRGRHGLWLVEDAAQAHGARWQDRDIASYGRAAAYSFYPTKNLGCFGDGGAVTSNEPVLVSRARRFGNHGQTSRYHHVSLGTNSRLDSLQAAVLNCRLPLLDRDNARRRALAAIYLEHLSGVGDLRFPKDLPAAEPVYHQMTILTEKRDELMRYLEGIGIGSSIHYPTPLHTQPALAACQLPAPGELPVATTAARECLCLPIFPELKDDEVEVVCAGVRSFFD